MSFWCLVSTSFQGGTVSFGEGVFSKNSLLTKFLMKSSFFHPGKHLHLHPPPPKEKRLLHLKNRRPLWETWKTNIEPNCQFGWVPCWFSGGVSIPSLKLTAKGSENRWLEDKFPFAKANFQGRAASLREGMYFFEEGKNGRFVFFFIL